MGMKGKGSLLSLTLLIFMAFGASFYTFVLSAICFPLPIISYSSLTTARNLTANANT